MTRLSLRSVRTLAAAALVVAAAAACSAPGEVIGGATGVDVRFAAADSMFTGIDRFHSGLGDSATYAVRTAAEWAALWAKATSDVQPKPTAPAVDFSKNMVLVVAMGGRSTGGYGVTIDRVVDTDDGHRVVESTLSRPARECIVTQSVTAPFAAIVAPATTAPVQFVNRSVEHHCS